MSNTEVITAAEATTAELQSRAETINERVAIIANHETVFEDSTLEHRLIIGLELAHAKAAFGMSKADAGALGGSMSPGDMLPNSLGFSNWLAREVPDFKRAKADLYINAFNALGVPLREATESIIREKIKTLNHHADKDDAPRPTLKSLYRIGKPPKNKTERPLPKLPTPAGEKEDEADLAELDSLQIIKALAKFIQSGRHQILTKTQIIHLDQQLLAAREVIRPFTK